MATTFNIRYKNHATPQEQHTAGDRFYLDSDVGRKMTGVADTVPALTGTLTEGASVSTTSGATPIASSKDFVYVKNTGSAEIYLSLTTDSSAEYVIALAEGEAFASQINTSANVRVKTSSGTSTMDHYVAT